MAQGRKFRIFGMGMTSISLSRSKRLWTGRTASRLASRLSTMVGGRTRKIYGDKIVGQDQVPGFALPLVLKDMHLAVGKAEKAGAPVPSVEVARDRLATGIARGQADRDWTMLGLFAEEEAGLPGSPLSL